MPVTRGQGNPDWTRDETILALDLVQRQWPKIPGKTSPEVKALSDLIRRLPIHAEAQRNEKFRNTDGVYMKLQNLASMHPGNAERKGLRTSQMDRDVWADLWTDRPGTRHLADQIAKGIEIIEVEGDSALDLEDDFEAVEGAVLTRVHRLRERRRGFRIRVIRRAERSTTGVRCAACGLGRPCNGPAGIAMFEVHHIVPLCDAAATVTRLEDLVLLCANCHRLIHAAMRIDRCHYGIDGFCDWRAQHASALPLAGGR